MLSWLSRSRSREEESTVEEGLTLENCRALVENARRASEGKTRRRGVYASEFFSVFFFFAMVGLLSDMLRRYYNMYQQEDEWNHGEVEGKSCSRYSTESYLDATCNQNVGILPSHCKSIQDSYCYDSYWTTGELVSMVFVAAYFITSCISIYRTMFEEVDHRHKMLVDILSKDEWEKVLDACDQFDLHIDDSTSVGYFLCELESKLEDNEAVNRLAL